MTTLTKQQATFLRKALGKNKRLFWTYKIHVMEYDGRTYAAATDGYVIHAVPADATPGVYDLGKDGTLTLNPEGCKLMEWARCIPKTLDKGQTITKQRPGDWKTQAGDDHRIVIDLESKYTVDYRYYCNATSYDKTCTQRMPIMQPLRPMRLDYTDGTLAVVMPMYPKS